MKNHDRTCCLTSTRYVTYHLCTHNLARVLVCKKIPLLWLLALLVAHFLRQGLVPCGRSIVARGSWEHKVMATRYDGGFCFKCSVIMSHWILGELSASRMHARVRAPTFSSMAWTQVGALVFALPISKTAVFPISIFAVVFALCFVRVGILSLCPQQLCGFQRVSSYKQSVLSVGGSYDLYQ